MTDLGIDRVTGTIVPWLSVVGLAISRRLPIAYCSSEVMSSMLRDSGMGSYSVKSAFLVGADGSSSWEGGVATGVGVGCSTGSGVDC